MAAPLVSGPQLKNVETGPQLVEWWVKCTHAVQELRKLLKYEVNYISNCMPELCRSCDMLSILIK